MAFHMVIGAAALTLSATGIAKPVLPEAPLHKEPTYASKSPKYLLFAFGGENPAHVWIALDGEHLYVDRDGDGDLTEAGEKLSGVQETAFRTFETDIQVARAGKIETIDLRVRVIHHDDGPPGCFLSISGDGRRKQYAGFDEGEPLRFAGRHEDASMVRFGGPLTIALRGNSRLKRGEARDLFVMVGTPGHGKGSFAAIDYKQTPEKAHPVAELEFPPPQPGGEPVRIKVSLTERF